MHAVILFLFIGIVFHPADRPDVVTVVALTLAACNALEDSFMAAADKAADPATTLRVSATCVTLGTGGKHI